MSPRASGLRVVEGLEVVGETGAWLRPAKAAQHLGCSETHLWRMRKAAAAYGPGDPAVLLGARMIAFRPQALDELALWYAGRVGGEGEHGSVDLGDLRVDR